MTQAFEIAFWIHISLVWALAGMTWMLHWVHYPLMRQVPKEEFAHIDTVHVHCMRKVANPAMFFDAVTGGLLLVYGAFFGGGWTFLLNGILLALGIYINLRLRGPIHKTLMRSGWDAVLFKRLTIYNEYRLGLWTIRGLLLIAFGIAYGTL